MEVVQEWVIGGDNELENDILITTKKLFTLLLMKSKRQKKSINDEDEKVSHNYIFKKKF